MNPESENSGPPPEPSPGSTADVPAQASAARLAEIRAAVRALDPGSDPDLPSVPIGVPAIDGHLPWGGLALPGLHEIVGMPADGAAVGFIAALLGRLGRGRAVLWSSIRRPGLYGYGLADLGADPAGLLLARGRRPEDVLWQLGEGLRSGATAAVVGDGVAPDLTASRRLQLAAEAARSPAFILLPAGTAPPQSVALTRWRVMSRPSPQGRPVWCLDLQRCRGGAPARWCVEWDDEAVALSLAAEMADGSLATAAE
jgi:protein ImuA